MQTLPLGDTGRSTTQLGFGCSSIMGVLNRRQSLALLESAFDAGIRHFDTAPMYGYGEAESCLGEFLSRHRGNVTVTTKFGIPAPNKKGWMQLARAAGGPLIQRFPALKKHLQRAASAAKAPVSSTAPVANPIFTAERARASLEHSLRSLQTERIDLWLLHDVKPIDLDADTGDDSLLRLLEDSVAQGKVGIFGAGTDREIIPELTATHPEYCGALQYEWSVFNPIVAETASFRIHHRALSAHFHTLAETLNADTERCRRWSREVDADLSNSVVLAQLMLKASLVLNPGSTVLFSSKRPEHIRSNVAVAENVALEQPARRFYALMQREHMSTMSH